MDAYFSIHISLFIDHAAVTNPEAYRRRTSQHWRWDSSCLDTSRIATANSAMPELYEPWQLAPQRGWKRPAGDPCNAWTGVHAWPRWCVNSNAQERGTTQMIITSCNIQTLQELMLTFKKTYNTSENFSWFDPWLSALNVSIADSICFKRNQSSMLN